MNLIVIHKNKKYPSNNGEDLLRFAASNEPIAGIIFDGLNKSLPLNHNSKVVYAISEEWDIKPCASTLEIIPYTETVPTCLRDLRFDVAHRPSLKVKRKITPNSWFAVSNGRFAIRINPELLNKVLAGTKADIIAVDVSPQLQADGEKVLINSQDKLVGFRRLYSNSAQVAPIPDDWPHYLFIKTVSLKKLLVNDALPLSFTKLINDSFANSLKICSLIIGGTVLDLGTEEGLLGFLTTRFNSSAKNHSNLSTLLKTGQNNGCYKEISVKDNVTISPSARLFGKVLLGQNVSIGPNTIIVGPTIVGNDVKIAKGAVIRTSIIGPGASVPQNSVVQSRVLLAQPFIRRFDCAHRRLSPGQAWPCLHGLEARATCENNFRTWPRFSYARCFKRIADIIAAIVVLILFAPIFPIIALVIKLTSRGEVFFKDPRQGLHGKAFKCLKFRTMVVGADKIQDKLRALNQTDGPQFKMADDPRLSAVGSFLRETYIDEIPQFLNVLLGQMSVVGPRPSPESENTLCPSWRDARLSVRPGITGLWQVFRTRQPMKDFQEWIHYDTKYVRELSLKMDMRICWQTAKKMVKNFISHF
jgi:lipopolysaccharide/colanic/teichoic acid biosynthesis glycosyltransferase